LTPGPFFPLQKKKISNHKMPLIFQIIIRGHSKTFYRAFHRFGQAKFANGGLVLGSSQFTVHTFPAVSRNDA